MTESVIKFPGKSCLDWSAERVLEECSKTALNEVVVIGWTKDTDDFFFYCSQASAQSVLWLLERAKFTLMEKNSSPPAYPDKPA